MAGLLVHVEGETEETFVNEMLSRHLQTVGYERVSARLLGNSRLRVRRGGIRPWTSVKRDIVRHLKEDRLCLATTMVDYYGLPKSGDRAWPGREAATSLPVTEKASPSKMHSSMILSPKWVLGLTPIGLSLML